jgi:hypothetical protein
MAKTKAVAEFGDFQTPDSLAQDACRLLAERGIEPASLVEPTCGKGSFLAAGVDIFPRAARALGLELNERYLEEAGTRLKGCSYRGRLELIHGDFFATDWPALFASLPEPILVLGNPPWVTNAHLGVLGSTNLPPKWNFQNHAGLDAITGKANFDISEWMLLRLLDALNGRQATLALLCKTVVARKALLYAWRKGYHVAVAELHLIDTGKHFGAAVDACLIVLTLAPGCAQADCTVYPRLRQSEIASNFGFRDGSLVADIDAYQRLKYLQGKSPYRWRSGIKHDCGSVMELLRDGNAYRNGLGELVELEDKYLYPMMKGSEIANGKKGEPSRFMLVTQRTVGQDTREIEFHAPKTWQYLLRHADALGRRSSSIYRNRPSFSVFGVGDYAFTPWKVAICGFYKKVEFTALGSWHGKPVVLDDTSYFVPCRSHDEARLIEEILNSDTAKAFFSAFIFWDSKRPITVGVLELLDLVALAKEMGRDDELARLPRGELQQTGQRSFLFD